MDSTFSSAIHLLMATRADSVTQNFVNSATTLVSMRVLYADFNSVKYIPKIGIAGSYCSSIPFLRTCHTDSHNGYTNLVLIIGE